MVARLRDPAVRAPQPSGHPTTSLTSSTSASVKASVVAPPGYTSALIKVRRTLGLRVTHPPLTVDLQSSGKNATAMIKAADLSGLRQQKAWDLALAPAKNVPMQGASRGAAGRGSGSGPRMLM